MSVALAPFQGFTATVILNAPENGPGRFPQVVANVPYRRIHEP
jgi:hypothetical protein